MKFADFGDSIDGECSLIYGIHSSTEEKATPINLPNPPKSHPKPIAEFIYVPFNRTEYVCSYAKDSLGFNTVHNSFRAVEPTHLPDELAIRKYHLVKKNDNSGFLYGTSVYDTKGIAPALEEPNEKIFRQLFGIEFDDTAESSYQPVRVVQAISPFEYSAMFGFDGDITSTLAKENHFHLLDGGIPARTSAALLNAVFICLTDL